MKIQVSSLVLLALVAAACDEVGPPTPVIGTVDVPADVAAPDHLAQALELGVKNPTLPEPDLLCTGQPTEEQFAALVELGFQRFINLREPTEEGTGWESERAATLGVSYVSLPISGATGITEENARALHAELARSEDATVLYCGSSNRVGALLGLAAFHVDGLDAEASLGRAKAAGVTRLEPKVRELLGL